MPGGDGDRPVADAVGDPDRAGGDRDQGAVAAVRRAPAGALIGGGRVVPARLELPVRVAEDLVDDLRATSWACGASAGFVAARASGAILALGAWRRAGIAP